VAADWNLAEYLHGDLKEAYIDPSTLRVDDPPALPKGKICGRISEFTKFAQRADRADGVEIFGTMNWNEMLTEMGMSSWRVSFPCGSQRRGIGRSLRGSRITCSKDAWALAASCSRTGCFLVRFSCVTTRRRGCRGKIFQMLTTMAEYRSYALRRMLLALLLRRIASLADLLSSVWSLVGKQKGVTP